MTFQKEHKKKEDLPGRMKSFRPEASGSSRDSTGTQPSSKSGSHPGQSGPHGHHREPYNSANKRHFGGDGAFGRLRQLKKQKMSRMMKAFWFSFNRSGGLAERP